MTIKNFKKIDNNIYRYLYFFYMDFARNPLLFGGRCGAFSWSLYFTSSLDFSNLLLSFLHGFKRLCCCVHIISPMNNVHQNLCTSLSWLYVVINQWYKSRLHIVRSKISFQCILLFSATGHCSRNSFSNYEYTMSKKII